MCSIIVTIYWPDYYKEFRCKAGKCLHTCCAGWLVGIDEKSLERFEKEPDIKNRISDSCFIMGKDGRCPFLRDDNLCDMILKHGEDYLCDICREHPRFYNSFDDHMEAGIGLVCEEACRLVLECDKPFELIASDGSQMALPGYVAAVFDDSKSLTEKLSEISGGRRAGSKIRAEIFNGMDSEEDRYMRRLVKAADKLSALIKCMEETGAGNGEFRTAQQSTQKAVEELAWELPEVKVFLEEFLNHFTRGAC